LLGGECDRFFDTWDAGPALYEVASKAVNPERRERYPSLAAFQHAWGEAKGESEQEVK
jgi:serine/threonine protein kinase, bacterial